MAKTWGAVVASPEFQALPPERQRAARERYFNTVVLPRAKGREEAAKQRFDAYRPEDQLPQRSAGGEPQPVDGERLSRQIVDEAITGSPQTLPERSWGAVAENLAGALPRGARYGVPSAIAGGIAAGAELASEIGRNLLGAEDEEATIQRAAVPTQRRLATETPTGAMPQARVQRAIAPESIAGRALEEQAAIERDQAAARPNDPRIGTIESGVAAGLESLGQNVAPLALSILTGSPIPMVAGGTAITTGQSYGPARRQGLTAQESLAYAGRQGAIEGTTELIPGLRLFKDIKLGSPVWKTVANNMLREQVGEQTATVLQDFNDFASLPENRNKTFSDYIAERPDAAVQTAIATAVASGIQSLGAAGIGRAMRQQQSTVQAAETLKNAGINPNTAERLAEVVGTRAADQPLTRQTIADSVDELDDAETQQDSPRYRALRQAGLNEQDTKEQMKRELMRELPEDLFADFMAGDEMAQMGFESQSAIQAQPEAAQPQTVQPAEAPPTVVPDQQRQLAPTIAEQPQEQAPIRLYRGTRPGVTGETVGGAEFMSPDENVARTYAGQDGNVASEEVQFQNLLEAPRWTDAKQMIGLPKSATMEDLINRARDLGHDGISFETTNGREYVVIRPEQAAPAMVRPATQEPPEGAAMAPAAPEVPIGRQQQESINAIEERQQQQDRERQRAQAGEGRPSAEAGRGNRAGQGRQVQAQEVAMQERPPSERPMAVPGLQSYRYRGPMGPVMIGAKNTEDALREARRSIEDKRHIPATKNLERWDGEKYVPVRAPAQKAVPETPSETPTTQPKAPARQPTSQPRGPAEADREVGRQAEEQSQEEVAGTWRHSAIPDATATVTKTEKGYRAEFGPDDVQEFRGPTAAKKLRDVMRKEGFTQGGGDVMAAASRAPKRNTDDSDRLAAVHNLSAENLAFADRIGGIAVPSIAVVRPGQSIDGFGEITLIGTRGIADPEQEPVFDSDAYSPRFPKPDYAKVSTKVAQPVTNSFREVSKEFDDPRLIDLIWDNAVNTPNPQRIIEGMLRSRGAMAQFIRETGGTANPVTGPANIEMEFVGAPAFQGFIKNGGNTDPDHGDTEARKALTAAVKKAIGENSKAQADGDADVESLLRKAAERAYIDEDGLFKFGMGPRLQRSINQVGRTDVLPRPTEEALTEQISGREEEFKTWVESKILPMFKDPTIKVGGRKVPYTLPNIVEAMTGRVRGREETMTYSSGQARAARAKRFSGLEQMRRAAMTQIKSEEEVAALREDAEKTLSAYRDAVVPSYTETNYRGEIDTWGALDASMRALSKAGPNRERLKSALRAERFDVSSLDEATLDLGTSAARALFETPVPYFEAKPQRAVTLDEFAGAVIPDTASAATKAILDRNGIPYSTYPSGDRGARAKAIADMQAGSSRGDVLFAADGSRRASALTPASIRAIAAREFGERGVSALEDKGILNIVRSSTDLPRHLRQWLVDFMRANPGSMVKALHDGANDRTYLIADQISPREVRRLILHEIGEHYGLERMLGQQAYRRLFDRIRALNKMGSKPIREAWDHVKDVYPSLDEGGDVFVREVIARAGESAQIREQAWWKDMLAAIRRFLFRNGFTSALSDQDVLDLVMASLQAQMEPVVRTSTFGMEAQPSMAAAGRDQIESETFNQPRGYSFNEEDYRPAVVEWAKEKWGDAVAPNGKPTWQNFVRYFGDSKVVDADGKPLVMFHGSNVDDIREFRGRTGDGMYFSSNADYASGYGDVKSSVYGGAPTTYSVYLSIQNPLELSGQDEAQWEKYTQRGFSPAELAKHGYDGIVMRYDDGEVEAMALRPEQIKSAVGNVGAFDPNNPSILAAASRRPPQEPAQRPLNMPAQQIGLGEETRLQTAQRLLQDKFNRVSQAQRAITESGRSITDPMDVYAKEQQFHGKTASRMKVLEDLHADPLIKDMAASRVDLDALDKYLYAKHAPEANAYIATINPQMPDGGSGMTTQEAIDYMNKLSPEQRKTMDRLAGRVYRMNNSKLQIMESFGLIDPEQAKLWKNQYQFYVPLKSDIDPNARGTGMGYDIRGKETKQRLGRRSLASSPTLNSIRDFQRTIIRAGKAEVGQAFLSLVKAYPDLRSSDGKLLWEIKEPADFQTRRIVESTTVNPITGETVRSQSVEWGYDPMFKMDDSVFAVKDGGQQKYVQVNDPILAKQLKNVGDAQLPAFLRVLGTATRALSVLHTGLNPEFWVTNAARDIQTALTHVQDLKDRGLAAKGITRQVARDVLKPSGLIRGIYLYDKKVKSDNPRVAEWQKWMADFERNGARVGFYGLEDLNGLAKDVEKKLSRANDARARSRVVMDAAMDTTDAINSAFENMLRLSAYRRLVEAGVSKQKAAVAAKNLTVNFNKKGEWSNNIGALYMFFNAAVQGTARTAQAAIKSKTVRRIMGAYAVAGILTAIWNSVVGGDDEETGEQRQREYSDWSKNTNMLVLAPDGDTALKIPLAYGYNLPYVMGYRVAEAALDPQGSVGKVLGNIAATALGVFDPTGLGEAVGEVFKGNPRAAIPAATPSTLRPLVEVAVNRNFMGNNISPEPFGPNDTTPDSERAWAKTPEFWKSVARAANEVTGGNQFEAGAVSVSPETLQHLVEAYTGGAGRFLSAVSVEPGANVAAGKVPFETPAKAPILRRLVADAYPGYSTSRFYEIAKKLEPKRKLIESADVSDAESEKVDKEWGDAVYAMKDAQSAVKKLRDAIRDAEDETEKAELEAEMATVMNQAIAIYNETERKQ